MCHHSHFQNQIQMVAHVFMQKGFGISKFVIEEFKVILHLKVQVTQEILVVVFLQVIQSYSTSKEVVKSDHQDLTIEVFKGKVDVKIIVKFFQVHIEVKFAQWVFIKLGKLLLVFISLIIYPVFINLIFKYLIFEYLINFQVYLIKNLEFFKAEHQVFMEYYSFSFIKCFSVD